MSGTEWDDFSSYINRKHQCGSGFDNKRSQQASMKKVQHADRKVAS